MGLITFSAPYHVNGTTTTTPVSVSTLHPSDNDPATGIIINNTGSDSLKYSFDGGSNYATLLVGQTLQIQAWVSSIMLMAATTTTAYEMVLTSGKVVS